MVVWPPHVTVTPDVGTPFTLITPYTGQDDWANATEIIAKEVIPHNRTSIRNFSIIFDIIINSPSAISPTTMF